MTYLRLTSGLLLVLMLPTVAATAQNEFGATSASFRIGWMVTDGEGYVDRPVAEGTGAYAVVRSSRGRPGINLTGSAGVGIGDAFAERTLWSFRFSGGVEGVFQRDAISLVPFGQLGYLTSMKEDERRGLFARVGVGVRISSGPVEYSIEPLSITVLPQSDLASEDASRLAIEVGVFRIGRRF